MTQKFNRKKRLLKILIFHYAKSAEENLIQKGLKSIRKFAKGKTMHNFNRIQSQAAILKKPNNKYQPNSIIWII